MLTTTVLAPPVIAVGLVTKSSIAVCWSCGGEVGTGGGAEIETLDLFLDFFLPPPRPFPCDMVSWVCMGPVWCCWRLEGCLQRLNGMCNASPVSGMKVASLCRIGIGFLGSSRTDEWGMRENW